MEHSNNPFAVLASAPASPTLHAPTSSLHEAPTSNTSLPPLPITQESLNNSTLIPSQTPSGMVAVYASRSSSVVPATPSPSPEQIATVGANILAQLNALENASYHPSAASNPLDHADDPDLSWPACPTRPPASPRTWGPSTVNLGALYRERAARHIEGSNPTTYSSHATSMIAAFLVAHDSPAPSGWSHTPTTPGQVVSSVEAAEVEAARLLDAWLAEETVILSDLVRDNYRRDFICGMDGFHPAIWELACWLHLAPIDRVDGFFHRLNPSFSLLRVVLK
ncbi:hypothetical protein EDB85DRAFT_2153526 [Lactarius pseudohatsudake]|nr:hypothetical protein EDB85DRAFT_2153526 [Lactarius pseudohatsudake]